MFKRSLLWITLALTGTLAIACSDDPAPESAGGSVVEQAQSLCPSYCDVQIRCSLLVALERDNCIAECRTNFFSDLPSNCALDEDAATACANAMTSVTCDQVTSEEGVTQCDSIPAVDLVTGGVCDLGGGEEDAGGGDTSGNEPDAGGGTDGGGGETDGGGGETDAGGGGTDTGGTETDAGADGGDAT
jgi:hypothetical protein